MQDESGRLVIYLSRANASAFLVGAVALVGLAVAFALYGEEMGAPVLAIAVAAGAGVPFFGACAVYLLHRLVVPRPALVVDEEGIYDNATLMAVGLIRWEEIERVEVYRFQGQVILGIYPKNLVAVLARQGWLKRRLIRLNLKLGCAPINIPEVAVPIKVEELARWLERCLQWRSRREA
jgi:hypothetical protein